MDWKGIAEKIVVAVTAGIMLGCLGWLYSVATAPNQETLVVVTRWVDVPNPLYGLDLERHEAFEQSIARTFNKIGGLDKVVHNLKYEFGTRLVQVSIKNMGDVRSKEIEVIVKNGYTLSPSMILNGSDVAGGHIHLAPLDPRGVTAAYVVVRYWSSFDEPPISVLHDGRLIKISNAQIPQEAEGMLSIATNFPYLIGIFFLVGILTCFVFPIVVFSKLIFGGRLMALSAWVAGKDEIKKYVKFIDYIATHYPEKMPEQK
jgi:hypothetical protein